MSHALLHQLDLRRAIYLWGCLRVALELGDRVQAFAKGEINFVFGTEDDPNRPTVYLDTLNLVVEGTDEFFGPGGTPSVCLMPGSRPTVDFDVRSRRFEASFMAMVDFPALRRRGKEREADLETDTPGPAGLQSLVELRGLFPSPLRPVEFGYEMLEAEASVILPPEVEKQVGLARLVFPIKIPLRWIRITSKRQLTLQPVFIAGTGAAAPTGEDFYPGLHTANELWGRCCIQFVARCPIYVDEQDWRVATVGEAIDFKNSTDVSDAIEVFIVEALDPVDQWGGGATFASGTATAKVVSTDNQLPLNQNHLAHELGHVLALGHPGDSTDALVDGCAGSVMEPSGFFADNPGLQCESNCLNASNPLLRLIPWQWCLSIDRADDQLF